MYDCPNCGGNLRFDIASQKLFCEYCESVMDPYEPERRSSGMQVESRDEYDVTVFTCPACGAEIASTNLSATGFCTYCGASAVFEKRVRGEKRPQRIIPFARTKEDCRNAYLNAIRHAAYVPKELKDPAFLDRFVGVYIPYWSYDVSFGPDLSFTGKKTYTKGNYEYTDYYDLNCQVAPVTQHMSFDASSSFDDHIGEVIGPFDEKGLLPFTPGFLAGFYSDIADVPSEIYYDDAEAAVAGEVYPQLEKQFPGYTVDMPRNRQKVEQDLKMQTSAAGAMFPVWFLTWRKDDRVAYSVVNGQTGKVYADIPVDLRQFLLFSLLLAVPLFVLLNLFLTITAPSMLALAAISSFLTSFLYRRELAEIQTLESKKEDAGYLYSKNPQDKNLKKMQKDAFSRKRPSGKLVGAASIIFTAAVVIIYAMSELSFLYFMTEKLVHSPSGVITILAFLLTLIWTFRIRSIAKELKSAADTGTESPRTKKLKSAPEAWGCIAASILALIIFIWYPVGDIYYYIGSAIAYLCIVLTISGLIRKYNLLATRPLPQFHNRTKTNPGMILLLVLACSAAAFLFPGGTITQAGSSGIQYTNPDTGYSVYLSDDEDLLTDGEERLLVRDMTPITEYGNVGFVSGDSGSQTARWYAESRYQSVFGTDSGTMLVIDMDEREIRIHSDGKVYRTITNAKANTITDNIYRYATREEYYLCAEHAFEEILSVLKGQRIAQPMKYLSNALLALILSVLLNFSWLKARAKKLKPKRAVVLAVSGMAAVAAACKAERFIRQTKVYHSSSSGGGGGGRGGGGGGGGHSGGGGGHRF